MSGCGVYLTFCPPPHRDRVPIVKTHCCYQFAVVTEVHAAHTDRVRPLQYGQSLLGLDVPNVYGGVLPYLARGHNIGCLGTGVEGETHYVVIVL